jgi:hypothetical protein
LLPGVADATDEARSNKNIREDGANYLNVTISFFLQLILLWFILHFLIFTCLNFVSIF